MKNSKILMLSLLMGSLTIASCGKTGGNNSAGNHKTYDNETTPLVFATTDLDGLFNPFYYTSGNDGSIIGMTQISMFTTDKNANIAYGENEPVVVMDYEQTENSSDNTTTYTFVIKNPSKNVKFSNGSYLTLQDVLFNMYEYLDPVYTGSSTMYSTDIVGLNAYRTQQDDKAAQDAFEEKFTREANERVNQLVSVMNEIKEAHKTENLTTQKYTNYLQEKESEYSSNSEYKNADKFVEDFTLVKDTFLKELNDDYTNNQGSYESNGLENDIESFLYAEGLITIDLDKAKDDPERIDYVLGKDVTKALTKEEAINYAFEYYFPEQFNMIVNYWATAETIRTQFIAEAKDNYFNSNSTERKYKNISGIKVITEDTVVNGKNYSYARYDSKGNKTAGAEGGYEMFSITINGVDPKAIWNFSFSVAPMYYYSNSDQINKFDYTENFGVEYGSSEFQTKVIKDKDKQGVPVGAGAYKATTKNTESDKVTGSSFFDSNVVYFERNDNFLMGKPKIKLMRYKVVSANQMLNSLFEGEVHYCEPSAKQEVINDLNSKETEGFTYTQAKTLGYGYIGINAKDVPSVYARQAIMSSMDTKLTLDYYPGTAEVIHRPMSKISWAYPQGCTAYYPYDATGETSLALLKKAGYNKNSKGVLVDKDGKPFKYTFTISGDSLDHPSYQTMLKSAQLLNKIGCDIEVKNDNNALQKLSTGDLSVWAAAWSSTIDPDMYQTYHKKSNASSTKNWGYPSILHDTTGKYTYEQGIIDDLSTKIEEAREILDQKRRATIYSECLDLVMDLAVELPTYQRNDLFAYNSGIIDTNTMTPKSEVSPYNGPINQIWNLSLITK